MKLPLFKADSSIVYQIYVRNVIPIALSCRGKIDNFTIINSSLEFLEISAATMIILGVIYLVLLIFTAFNFETMYIYRAIVLVVYVIIFVSMHIEISKFSGPEQKCFDHETQEFLSSIQSTQVLNLSFGFHMFILVALAFGEIYYLF